MGSKNSIHDRQRVTRLSALMSAQAAGAERLADSGRKCPVVGCDKEPRTYSRYCKRHADRLRYSGHPTLDIKVQTNEQYANLLKIGRWVRHKLSADEMDQRAWVRVERELVKLSRDPVFRQHSVATIARRHKHWRNRYKAGLVLVRRLNVTDVDPQVVAEEVIAAYLGMAAVIIRENDVLVNSKQLAMFLNKAGARAIMRHMRFHGVDEFDKEKLWRWHPSPGTVTAVGATVNEMISRAVGGLWWKRVDEIVATLGGPTERPKDDPEDGDDNGGQ